MTALPPYLPWEERYLAEDAAHREQAIELLLTLDPAEQEHYLRLLAWRQQRNVEADARIVASGTLLGMEMVEANHYPARAAYMLRCGPAWAWVDEDYWQGCPSEERHGAADALRQAVAEGVRGFLLLASTRHDDGSFSFSWEELPGR